jgi:hypothetical protein
MLIIIATLLAVTAIIFILRLLWVSSRTGDYGTLLAVLAALLVLAVAALAATGRLHWLTAVIAAIVPFMRRIVGLLRYLPLFGRLFSRYRGGAGSAGKTAGAAAADMNRARALEILGLGPRPTREEVIAAHRRLMQKLHPDLGGSTYLAQQLNEARKILLDELS